MKVTPENVENLAKRKEKQNWKFRAFLKMQSRLSDEELDEIVFRITRRVWENIDCTTCARCCKELHPGLTEAEQRCLAKRLSLSLATFREEHLSATSYGDSNKEELSDDGEPILRIPVTPCPFLTENKCSVYEERPAECRDYPYLYKEEFVSRTIGMIGRTFTCPIVYEVFEQLKEEIWHRR